MPQEMGSRTSTVVAESAPLVGLEAFDMYVKLISTHVEILQSLIPKLEFELEGHKRSLAEDLERWDHERSHVLHKKPEAEGGKCIPETANLTACEVAR